MFKKIYRFIVDRIKGNIHYQAIFERVCQSIFLSMNCGTGGNIQSSGELYVLKYLSNQLKLSLSQPITIFDVGANIGEYSECVLNFFTDDVRVFAFEPSLATYNLLSQNIDNKTLNKYVKLYNFGLSNENTSLSLFSELKNGSKIASVYQDSLDRWGVTTKKEEIIRVRKLDEFCLEEGIDRIHFLKIDVEGHEFKVLEGAHQMINSGRIDYIQFEFGHCNLDSRTYLKDFFNLLNSNYKLYRIVKNGIYPLEKYKEMYEIFYTTNYLAEHRKFVTNSPS